jgi:hypothetical protein
MESSLRVYVVLTLLIRNEAKPLQPPVHNSESHDKRMTIDDGMKAPRTGTASVVDQAFRCQPFSISLLVGFSTSCFSP